MIRNDFTQATYSRLDAGNRLYSGHVLKVSQKVPLGMTSGKGPGKDRGQDFFPQDTSMTTSRETLSTCPE